LTIIQRLTQYLRIHRTQLEPILLYLNPHLSCFHIPSTFKEKNKASNTSNMSKEIASRNCCTVR